MGKYKKLATDTVLFTISSFGSKILTLFLTPLYTSLLTTAEYGIADLITTTINFIYPILTLAISDAALRFAFDKDKSKHCVLNTSLVFVFASTFLLSLFYPLFARLSGDISHYWAIFVITYLLFNLQTCISNFIKGLGYTKLFAVQGIIHTAAIIVSNIILLLYLKMGLIGYLYSIIIGYTIPILLMFIGAKLYKYIFPFEFEKNTIAEMLKYSIPMVPTLLAWSVNTYIDRYMIIYFYGLSESGIYSVAHKIPTIVTTVTTIFTQAWQLSVIDNYGKEGDGEFFSKVYRVFNILMVFAVMLFMPFSKLISFILFAKEYYTAWTAVPFLLISSMYSSLAGFLAAAFRASKKTNGLMASVIVGGMVNIVLNLILLQFWGIIGAAIATAVSFMFVWCVRLKQTKKLIRVDVSAVPTAVTYSVVFITAFLYSFDFVYVMAVYAVALIIIIIFNYRDIKNMTAMIMHEVKRICRR